MTNFLNNLGTTEIIIIALILIILFGGKKMRELARGLGESTKEAKNLKKELTTSSKSKEKKEKDKEKDSE